MGMFRQFATIAKSDQAPMHGGGFAIGAFHVTPILTDHSAFDAYMLLIEGGGNRILYTPAWPEIGPRRSHHGRPAIQD
jgi:hypothetical protein